MAQVKFLRKRACAGSKVTKKESLAIEAVQNNYNEHLNILPFVCNKTFQGNWHHNAEILNSAH